MLRLFIMFVACSCLFVCNVTAENPPERDLLFNVSFDKMTALADYAKGNGEPLDFKSDLEFRPYEGFNSKNAFLRQQGETLTYDARENFNPLEGTLSLWIKPINWEPAGEGLKPLGHKHFVAIEFKTPVGHATLTIYKYFTGSDMSFLITTALNKQNWLAITSGEAYKKDQWLKLDATWAQGKMVFYINGKQVASASYENAYEQVAQAEIQSGRIMINPLLWGEENGSWKNHTAIDDVKIYSRALSPLEIQRKFIEQGGEVSVASVASPIQISGIDLDDGRLDRLRVNVDLNTLPEGWVKAIAEHQVDATGRLFFDKQEVLLHTWKAVEARWSDTLENAQDAGAYEFVLALRNVKTDEQHEVRMQFVKPDTSFYGNNYGMQDVVPLPWTPIVVDGNHVRVWNRDYEFDGPFIRQVSSDGADLLAQGVMLQVGTENGYKVVEFSSPVLTHRQNDHLVFAGRGQVGDLTISYTNTVWFDGYSRCQFTVGPVGEKLQAMRVVYKVKPEYATFLVTPQWQPFKPDGNDFTFESFRSSEENIFSQLWLMGEVNGFCWAPENEGNWVYADKARPIHVTRDATGAEVVLQLIDQPVTIPENLNYAFGFIATPTRPLPPDYRTFCSYGMRLENTRARIVGWGGKGFTGYATLVPQTNCPGKNYEDYLKIWSQGDVLAFPYASANGLNTSEPLVKFYQDSWEMPGMNAFPITDVYGHKYTQAFMTQTQLMRDFFIEKVEKLLSRQDPQIGGVYYDLCYVTPVRNPLAGGAFTDAFGRHIPSRLNTLQLREMLMRTLKICRKYGKRAWYHGHGAYNPAVMGLGDFWYPGEELASRLAKNPFYYAEQMPSQIFETEFNAHQKGVGVINLPVISRIYRDRDQDPLPTESMLGMMLLNDVISSATQANEQAIDKLWGIRIKYHLDEAKFVRYNQNADFTSSNPNIVCSYFKLPGGVLMAVLVNRSGDEQTAQVNFGGTYQTAFDAWQEKLLMLSERGEVNVTIPAWLFRVVVLKP